MSRFSTQEARTIMPRLQALAMSATTFLLPALAYAEVTDDWHRLQTKTLSEVQIAALFFAILCGIKVMMNVMSAASRGGDGGGHASKSVTLWVVACIGLFSVIPLIQLIKKQIAGQVVTFGG